MVQRKKDGVRDAILEAAFRLFSEQGYNDTSIPAIAREAGISTANIYVYFQSKLAILFQLYSPWLMSRLDKLERSQRRIKDPRERLRRLLLALWRDLPKENNGFTNNVMQAVSSGSGDYSPELRQRFQQRVAGWIQECLGTPLQVADMLAGVVLMAFDGFAMNVRSAHSEPCNDEIARLFSQLMLCAAAPPEPKG
ncbi:TetR/AcrR family transcriptional regulator [Pseudacidovorax intermedius]|uniref:TetR/AcrR family transcriptional regulator n=1 Tax=Pseudacidovorax intermedius TaxID=433924 RepID=UPI001B071D2A|nr:TetR/AcrR family transcriptional regulator [Pseudacidovorax intermedius]MBO9641911.1 TetR/AcrR family transcriptional regulator [Pseudacidovorax sp.]